MKKLALIVISIDECFAKSGFSGGGHKVTKYLIENLIKSGKFEIDIYCEKSSLHNIEGINAIYPIGKKALRALKKEDLKDYNYILSSDVLLPFGNQILHSNSAKFKTKNGKNPILSLLSLIYSNSKIKYQKDRIAKCKGNFFTVSNSLKEDFATSYNINKDRIFVCYPSIDFIKEKNENTKKDTMTIGSIAGGGLNKGGFLLLFAIKKFASKNNISKDNFRAKLIFPKIEKSGLFKKVIKVLGLSDFIELLPRQADMNAFYNSIDYYVLPSLNEAFGLVVAEAGANFKPSLVSNSTGVAELINNENGILMERTIHGIACALKDAYKIYTNNFESYQTLANKAHELPEITNWEKFTSNIIENLKEENCD